jgi:hypothetical protein
LFRASFSLLRLYDKLKLNGHQTYPVSTNRLHSALETR